MGVLRKCLFLHNSTVDMYLFIQHNCRHCPFLLQQQKHLIVSDFTISLYGSPCSYLFFGSFLLLGFLFLLASTRERSLLWIPLFLFSRGTRIKTFWANKNFLEKTAKWTVVVYFKKIWINNTIEQHNVLFQNIRRGREKDKKKEGRAGQEGDN